MSGGHFSYNQYRIRDIWEEISEVIYKTRNKIRDPDWDFVYEFDDDTLTEFEKGVKILKEAEIYAQRIDYLLSGDDGEESFHRRLREELTKLEEE